MDTEVISKNIAKKREQLAALEKEIEALSEDIKAKQRDYSQALLSYASQGKKPASVETRKRHLADASVELEGIKGAADLLRDEIEELENERQIALLFRLNVKPYHSAMEIGKTAVDAINEISTRLFSDIAELTRVVDALLSSSEGIRDRVKMILAILDPSISLKAFLDGEVQTIEQSDHETVVEQIGKDLQAIGRGVSIHIDTRMLDKLTEGIMLLSAWRTKVLSFEPLALMRNRQVLVGKSKKPRPHTDSADLGPDFNFVLNHKSQYSQQDIQKAEAALAANLGQHKPKEVSGLGQVFES